MLVEGEGSIGQLAPLGQGPVEVVHVEVVLQRPLRQADHLLPVGLPVGIIQPLQQVRGASVVFRERHHEQRHEEQALQKPLDNRPPGRDRSAQTPKGGTEQPKRQTAPSEIDQEAGRQVGMIIGLGREGVGIRAHPNAFDRSPGDKRIGGQGQCVEQQDLLAAAGEQVDQESDEGVEPGNGASHAEEKQREHEGDALFPQRTRDAQRGQQAQLHQREGHRALQQVVEVELHKQQSVGGQQIEQKELAAGGDRPKQGSGAANDGHQQGGHQERTHIGIGEILRQKLAHQVRHASHLAQLGCEIIGGKLKKLQLLNVKEMVTIGDV